MSWSFQIRRWVIDGTLGKRRGADSTKKYYKLWDNNPSGEIILLEIHCHGVKREKLDMMRPRP